MPIIKPDDAPVATDAAAQSDGDKDANHVHTWKTIVTKDGEPAPTFPANVKCECGATAWQ